MTADESLVELQSIQHIEFEIYQKKDSLIIITNIQKAAFILLLIAREGKLLDDKGLL
jgi:hypothetical protein